MSEPFNWELFNSVPIIAIMRNFPDEKLEPVVKKMHGAGLVNLEITMNSKDPLGTISKLRNEWAGKMNIGAGTVCTIEQLDEAVNAGAQFIVAPIIDEAVISRSSAAGIPIFPGAFTPTEIYNAWKWGAAAVKVFPATKLGPGYFKDVLEPLNQIKLMPTGGVNLDNFIDFLKAGATGVGIASSLFPKDMIAENRWDDLGNYYNEFVYRYDQFKKRKFLMTEYRSRDWFGKKDKNGFIHRSWMKGQGIPDHLLDGRPVIGICNTWSELSPCNVHLRDLAEFVKKGVYEAGGFPLEFPIMSLGETMLKPTAMLFRNLASMDVEESIRGNPMDGVVLLTGCDKTTPATVMGAASVGLPTIVVPGGPMLNGKFRGQDIGSGTHVWKFDEERKTGAMTEAQLAEAESCMSRSAGHCMTMGTASTMACMAESLGLSLSGAAAIPAVDSRKKVLAFMSGKRIVEMVKEDLTINKILTREAFENAIKVNAAIGGSTNFIIHMIAIAGRIGVELNLEDFDKLGSAIPLLLNLMPSGKFLMEDFYYAGGLPVILNEMKDKLHIDAITVSGKTHRQNIEGATNYDADVISSLKHPLKEDAGIVVLKGNLAINGAVIKPSAATPELMKHRGRAVVFETIEDYHARVDDPDLDIDETCVMVLKLVGPVGYPGMPEVGNMTLPKKLLDKGIHDMVRISDGRMSGTAYGTVVLHVSPESAIGGNLALVQNGDFIELDVAAKRLHLDVSDQELAVRRQAWIKPEPVSGRGYVNLYINHVQQSDKGADFDFLIGSSGSKSREKRIKIFGARRARRCALTETLYVYTLKIPLACSSLRKDL